MPTLPTLPQSEVDTTYSLPTGTTHNCTTDAEFSTALTDSALNDVIVLTAGNTFTGNFTLPNKTSGSGWIYIISSALANLPAGTRVAPADATDMAKIRTTGTEAAILTAAPAHHFRFVGIEISAEGATLQKAVVTIGAGETSAADLPHHIIFDRCYIHGSDTNVLRRGIAFNGNHLAAIECYISNVKEAADNQAIMGWNGEGPFKIHNNYLEAAGENVMFGGASAAITNLIPSDITITRNTFSRPVAWNTEGYVVKNLLEFKNAKRALVRGNLFENHWADDQSGFAWVITVRNEGSNDWSEVSDITFQYNKLLNTEAGINIHGMDDNATSAGSVRILFEHNLIELKDVVGGTWRLIQFINDDGYPDDFTFIHNTLVTPDGASALFMGFMRDAGKVANFYFEDNLCEQGSNGWLLDGDGGTSTAMGNMFDPYTFNNNAIVGSGSGYPTGNFFPANVAAVEFVDYNNGNYRLDPASDFAAGNANDASDGTDLGADIDAIEAAMAGEDEGGGAGQTGPRGSSLGGLG